MGDLRKRSLKGVTSLSPEAAAAVVEGFQGNDLTLNLTSLPADTAKELAKGRYNSLFVDRLTELSDEAAAALGTFADNKSGGDKLNLFGLTTLDAEAARGLAAFRGNLELDGLTEIDPETAAALATYAGPKLSLRRLKSLSAETAKQLAKAKAWDGDLRSLRSLSDEAAAALAGLEEPPAELAGLLPEFACKNLSLHPWEFYLGGKQPVTPADARLVAAYAGRLGKTCVLPKITGFETPDAVEVAEILAAAPGSLSIPNLKRVSPRTLTALIEKGNIELPPIEFIELIQEPDGSPTEDFMVPKGFQLRQKARQQGR